MDKMIPNKNKKVKKKSKQKVVKEIIKKKLSLSKSVIILLNDSG